MACELCHFYSYKYHEVTELDSETFDALYMGMERIKARNTLKDFRVSMYPKTSESARSKLHKDIYQVAYKEEMVKQAVTTDQLVGGGYITPDMVKNG
jgi:hypothetical protein